MAVRLTPSGFQSYDPSRVFNKGGEVTKKTETKGKGKRCPKGMIWDAAKKRCVKEMKKELEQAQEELRKKEREVKIKEKSTGGVRVLPSGDVLTREKGEEGSRRFTSKEWSDIVSAKFTGKTAGLTEEQEEYISKAGLTSEQIAGQRFLEEKEFEKEKFPERVELDIEREDVEEFPILGPAIAAKLNIIRGKAFEEAGLRDKEGKLIRPANKEDLDIFNSLMQNPLTARELTLQSIQEEERKKGTTGSEHFGSFIEGIHLGKIAGWLGGTIEAPAENVETALSEIKDSRGRILKKYEATRANLIDPFIAYQSILDEEENIYRLEQRIKNLSQESPELIADAEGINLVESKILRAKEVVFFAKQAAATQIRGEPLDPQIEAWLISEQMALGEIE